MKEGLLAEDLEALLEELGDAAAQPVATSEEQPSEIKPEMDNEDSFPAEEHEQSEEVKEVIVEGIEGETDLGDAAHVENEATSEEAPVEEKPELTNDDSHPAENTNKLKKLKKLL